jgi:outer membrane protein assembly factor BamB
MLWYTEDLGAGYSTVSICEDTIYVTGLKDKTGYLTAMDMAGKIKWQKPYGTEWTKSYSASRNTPTIDSGKAYIFSGIGGVHCLDANTGDKIWSVDLVERYNAKHTYWGMAESVIVDGDTVVCTPAGKDALLVGLNKNTGQTIWQTGGLESESSYSSPVLVEHGPKRMVVALTTEYVLGVDIWTGQLLWKYFCDDFVNPDHQSFGRDSMPVTPYYYNGSIYVTAGYDMGGARLDLSEDGRSVTKAWHDYTLDCHHGGVVIVDGFIYGSNWQSNTRGKWVCLEWETGKVMYETKWLGNKGCLTYADGMLYCYDEKKGTVALVKAKPDAFEVISSFQVTMGQDQHWAYPVVHGGRLYIRHGQVLMAYDVKEK